MNEQDLREEFVNSVSALREKIYRNCRAKCING